MTLTRDEPALTDADLLDEFEQLVAANAKSIGWGAAVGARHERIAAIRTRLKYRLSIHAQQESLRTCATCHAVLADGPQPAATYAQQANRSITDVDRSYANSILEDLADPDERDTPEQIVAQWICKVRTECSRGGINFGSQEESR